MTDYQMKTLLNMIVGMMDRVKNLEDLKTMKADLLAMRDGEYKKEQEEL